MKSNSKKVSENRVLAIRSVLIISVSVVACFNVAAEEESDSKYSIKDIYEIVISHSDNTFFNEDKIVKRLGGMKRSHNLIETSKDLVTHISQLPSKFNRPTSKQNIFRQEEWALVASPNWEGVKSMDGQMTVDITESSVSFITSNWQPTKGIRLAYRLSIDKKRELQSKYWTYNYGYIPHHTWQNVSDDFLKALEEGNTLEVALIDEDEKAVHVEEFSLSGFSENMTAVRKLLKNSPRPENND